MFNKGDKVVYPMHGAGIVEKIEEKEVDGKLASYYILNIPLGNLTITVPGGKVPTLNIRHVSPKEDVMRALDSVEKIPADLPEAWNKRYEYHVEKLKTGELEKVIEVYLLLYFREKNKGISTQEKKLLTNARQIILSEIIFSHDIERKQAEAMLNNTTKRFGTDDN